MHAAEEGLLMSHREEQLDMLTRVLSAGEEEAHVEDDDMTDDIVRTAKALSKRTVGSMSVLTGGRGLSYAEFGTEGRGSSRPRLTTSSGRARHALFRARAQGRI